MSTNMPSFTSENLDDYLKQVAKEYRKLAGKHMRAEIILIGGAAIVANYGFREMTYDIDAATNASSALDDAVRIVGDRNSLPVGWFNSDFRNTNSYTRNLFRYSQYYKTFSNVLEVRVISAEYLVAMKLVSGREYKNDLSDICGIIAEHQSRGTPITYEMIDKAVCDLYGNWESVSEKSQNFIRAVLENPSESLYEKYRNQEIEVRDSLVEFEDKYPGALNENNISKIIGIARKKKEESSMYSGIKNGLLEALAYVNGELTEGVVVHNYPDDFKPDK